MSYLEKSNYKEYIEKANGELDKFTVLKWIFDKYHFRYNDDLHEFHKNLTEGKDYKHLEVINTFLNLVMYNVLENVASLDCVKIVFEK